MLLAVFLFAGCGGVSESEWDRYEVGANDVYPGLNWVKVKAPETLGWSPELLAKARQFSDAFGLTAVMVVQGEIVVDEGGKLPLSRIFTQFASVF